SLYASDSRRDIHCGPTRRSSDLSVSVIKAGPAIDTTGTQTGNIVGSAVLQDVAHLTGGYNPTGTITFTVTAPDGSTTTVGSVTAHGDDTHYSPTITATAVGTYTL